MNPGFYILQKDKEKVDEGEIVSEGLQVKKKIRDPENQIGKGDRTLMSLKGKNQDTETAKVDAVMDSSAFDIVILKK